MSGTAPAASRGPVRFGKYLLQDRLAVGGMAEIFLAREEGRQRPLVLKRIRPHLSKLPAFVKMFLNEARLAAQLRHPNVVELFDLGKVSDSYYLAMEYVSGRDMRKIIPRADEVGVPFPLVYALKIAAAVCDGLGYAHQQRDLNGSPLGIVHRDITPENILVSFEGGVKILDFGIAKAAGQVEQTRAGEIKGKLSYLSPEQAQGTPLDARSDIFSLGVVLYEWLTGFRLFKAETEVAVLKSIIEGRVHAPSYFRPEIPTEVERIVMRALEKDREKRYATAEELRADIDHYLRTSSFVPTDRHLANFLRQLFAEELPTEEARLGTASGAPSAPEATRPRSLAEPAGSLDALGAQARPTEERPAVPADPPRLGDAPTADTDERPALASAELSRAADLSDAEGREATGPSPDAPSLAKAVPLPTGEGPPALPFEPGGAEGSSTEGEARGTEQFLPLALPLETLRRLRDCAARNGVSPEALAREILTHWLKYR